MRILEKAQLVKTASNNYINRVKFKIQKEAAFLFEKKEAVLPADQKIVSFTFDDFPNTSKLNGARILESHKTRGTFYTSLGLAGTKTAVGLISEQKIINSLSQNGHEIGCHTYGHLNCADTPPRILYENCILNQNIAKKEMNISFLSFAYPFGKFNLSSKRVIQNNYLTARTIKPGVNIKNIDLAALKSVPLYESSGEKNILKWLDIMDKYGGWLIFYTHDVRENPSQYGCTINLFEEILNECLLRNFKIMTVGAVAKNLLKQN
jgi:peptidoglycan/xylan/chitin deacetylase (PgdA/CDA1 family)